MTLKTGQETLKMEIYGPYWVTHVLNKVTVQDDERPDWMREEE
jgi:hypothetical protein